MFFTSHRRALLALPYLIVSDNITLSHYRPNLYNDKMSNLTESEAHPDGSSHENVGINAYAEVFGFHRSTISESRENSMVLICTCQGTKY